MKPTKRSGRRSNAVRNVWVCTYLSSKVPCVTPLIQTEVGKRSNTRCRKPYRFSDSEEIEKPSRAKPLGGASESNLAQAQSRLPSISV